VHDSKNLCFHKLKASHEIKVKVHIEIIIF